MIAVIAVDLAAINRTIARQRRADAVVTIRQSAIRHVRRRHRLAIDELPVDWIRARRIVRIRDRVDHIPERIAVAIDMEVNILRVDGQPSIAARNRVVLEEILRLVADSRLEIIAADMVRLRVILDITAAVIAVVIGKIRRLFRVAIRQAINQRDRLADRRTVVGAVVDADILRRDLQRRLVDDDVALNRNAVVLAGITAIFVDNAAAIRFQVILVRPSIRRSPSIPVRLISAAGLRRHAQANRRDGIAIDECRRRDLLEGLVRRAIRLDHLVGDGDGHWLQRDCPRPVHDHIVIIQRCVGHCSADRVTVKASIGLVFHIICAVAAQKSVRRIRDAQLGNQRLQIVAIRIAGHSRGRIEVRLYRCGITIGFRVVTRGEMQGSLVDGGIALLDLDVVVLERLVRGSFQVVRPAVHRLGHLAGLFFLCRGIARIDIGDIALAVRPIESARHDV